MRVRNALLMVSFAVVLQAPSLLLIGFDFISQNILLPCSAQTAQVVQSVQSGHGGQGVRAAESAQGVSAQGSQGSQVSPVAQNPPTNSPISPVSNKDVGVTRERTRDHLRVLRQKTTLLPHRWSYWLELGEQETRLKGHQIAVDYYTKACDLMKEQLKSSEINSIMRLLIEDNLATALDGRALAYCNLEKNSKAIIDLNEALRLRPKHSYYLDRALIYYKMDKQDLTAKDKVKAAGVKFDPKREQDFVDLYVKAYNSTNDQRFEDGIALATKSLDLFPNRTESLLMRARDFRCIGNFECAIKDYDTVLKAAPADNVLLAEKQQISSKFKNSGSTKLAYARDAAHESMALALHIGSDQLKPTDVINQFIAKYPNDCRGYIARGQREVAEKQWDEAIKDEMKAQELAPYLVHIDFDIADTYLAGHNWTKAIEAFDRGINRRDLQTDVLAFGPEMTSLETWITSRALAYRKLKQYAKAIDDYSLLLKVAPTRGEVYVKRAETYVELQKFDLALADYNSAIKADEEPTVSNLLARASVYEKLGKTDLARKDDDLARRLQAKRY